MYVYSFHLCYEYNNRACILCDNNIIFKYPEVVNSYWKEHERECIHACIQIRRKKKYICKCNISVAIRSYFRYVRFYQYRNSASYEFYIYY